MRPTKDEYFIAMAELVATRSTCLRRNVGCVLVNERGHVLATGYNGSATGLHHCNEPFKLVHPNKTPDIVYPDACEGADLPSGEGHELCEAIHAEQNALLQCKDVFEIHTVYCTTEPCVTCTKLLINTGAKRVLFRESHISSGRNLWKKHKPDLGSWSKVVK